MGVMDVLYLLDAEFVACDVFLTLDMFVAYR